MNATINIGHVYVGPFQNNLLGVNTEITRRGFFGGLSAEMLNNRKMFAGIDMPFGWECDGLRYVKDRQEESLCGSNWVILDNGTLSQSSDIIALENGREYECRLWIKPLSEHGAVTFGISGQERSFTVESGDAPYILLSMLLGMVGCGTDSAEETAVPAEQTQPAGEAETAETGYPAPDFSGLDFNGEKLSVITPNWHFYHYYSAEELTGESVNDAVYNRTVNTENALNVDVTVNQDYSDSETHGVVGQSIMAGDDAWHIVYTHSLFGVNTYVVEDQLYNMEALPYVDFAAPWWDKKSIDYFKIGDEVYYGRGDLVLTTTEVTLFNKDIAEDYRLPDHYEMVRQGKWTYGTFLSEVNMVSEDLNGDGKITNEDKVGFTAELTERLCGLPFAFGIHLTEATENGLEFTFWTEKYIDLYSKTLALINDSAHSQAYFRGATPENKQLKFASGNALFTFVDGAEIVGLRDAEMDFGVLPMPKYDEEQEGYYCYAWPTFVCVPTTIQNDEKVGAGLECFAYESQPVMKAYMMDLLRGKAARDEESVEMFDLIYDSQVIDIAASYLGFNPNTNKFFYMWSNNISGKKDSIASEYEKYKQAAEAELADLYETIINNQANH